MLSFNQFSKVLSEAMQLDEALITFGGKAYPKFGNIVIMAGGAGCHAKGTGILMYDGSIKKVEDISIGDVLMGPDSKPRNVLSLHCGNEEMVEVSVRGRETFRVNRNHIHSFVASYSKNGLVGGKVYNLTYDEYMNLTPTKRNVLKLYASTSIEFEEKQLPVDPYVVGYWLGDGVRSNTNIIVENKHKELVSSTFSDILGECYEVRDIKTDKENCSIISLTTGRNNKHNSIREFLPKICFDGEEKLIPEIYLTGSISQRKSLLAGLIDSDGHNGGKYYEIITCFPKLKDGIVRLARSLGYHVNISKKNTKYKEEMRQYDRITISGSFEDLPIKLEYKKSSKREQIKCATRYSAEFSLCGADDYYGFEVDSDNLYVMGNFMVTHNSGKGFVKDKLVGLEGFVYDVDALKLIATRTQKIVDKVKNTTGVDLSQMDVSKNATALKNPDTVGLLHSIIGDELKLDDKKKDAMIKSIMTSAPDRKPNLIFDITMREYRQFLKYTEPFVKLGYAKENIHVVWVVNDIEVAAAQNARRDRTVPAQILIDTHKGASATMKQIVDMGDEIRRYADGEIVLAFNKVGVDSEVSKSDKGGMYVVKANYVYLKKSGKPVDKDKFTADLRAKIASYVPDNVQWA